MATGDNVAPGQQNEPRPEKSEYRADLLDPEEINSGARNEDQLDKMKDNAMNDPDQNDQGSPPKSTLTQKEIEQGEKTFAQQPNGHKALETENGNNNGAIPAAFEGQTPNHP